MLEIRIRKIQKKLNIEQTSIFDINTCNALADLLSITNKPTNLLALKKEIQKKLGFVGNEVDGIYGTNTVTRIEFLLSDELPTIPQGASMIVSKNSVQFIIDSEVSSIRAYKSKYKFPTWPKSNSGITIGIGYDLGHVNDSKFISDWENLLDVTSINRLIDVLGLTGLKAKNALTTEIKNIEIPYEAAIEVFYTKSLPSYAKKTSNIYPGIEKLPPDVQGVLLSIVYNRGSSLEGERRKEMKNIVPLILRKDLKGIAKQIRSMKRLWENNPDTNGLVIRRENEAVLVENASYFMLPEEYIIV